MPRSRLRSLELFLVLAYLEAAECQICGMNKRHITEDAYIWQHRDGVSRLDQQWDRHEYAGYEAISIPHKSMIDLFGLT